MDDYLKINDIFGPTIQGEGFAAGQHCLFVRTFGCNLECSWCDTAKTWATTPDKAAKTDSGRLYVTSEQSHLMSWQMVVVELQSKWDIVARPTNIIVSGGEPFMQAHKLVPLTRKLFDLGNKVHVETAGTIKTFPKFDATVHQYNVSPKLQNSSNDPRKRYKPEALRSLMHTGKARFKFVVQGPTDFAEVDFICKDCDIPQQYVQVMPEGNTAEGNMLIAQEIIDLALERGYGLSFRSHVLIWGDREGV